MNYIRSIGYTNFIYHESTFNYGTLPRISVKDIQIVSLFTAIIVKTPQYNSIRNLILPWHQGEVNASEINRGYRVRKMIEALEVPTEIKFHFPLEHLTREEMAAALPTELLNSVHSCRKPTPQKPQCGTCKTCLEYIERVLNPR
ncbi:MAG TPA: hypothetical protein PKY29_04515 [Ferruginibacter sp.]|nr:hypothetical protein [Ferruginibacter sp.]HRQ20552.1 hypothetical protein [Ferruginibacter sp.]